MGMMIPGNGSVSPNTNRSRSTREPGMRRRPMANPAIVEMTRDTGTTASTMNVLDARSAVMFATLNASTKLPHCGSAGHSSPLGTVPDGCSAVVKMLMKGRIVNRHQRHEERPACPEFAASNLHRLLSRLRRWIGRMTTTTRIMSMTARADARPICSLGERKDVDLDPGDRRRVAGSAGRRDVDDVERGERGDHRDGQAHADLVSEKRDGDRDELPEPAGAIDPARTHRAPGRSSSCRSTAGRCRIPAAPRFR